MIESESESERPWIKPLISRQNEPPFSEPAHRLDPIPSVMLRRFPYFERTVYITSRKSEHRSKIDNFFFFFAASGRPRPHEICSATPLGGATPGLKNQGLVQYEFLSSSVLALDQEVNTFTSNATLHLHILS